MVGNRYNSVAPEAIIVLLREYITLTKAELARLSGINEGAISNALSRMRKRSSTLPKRVYIKEWVREVSGKRDYLRPSYAVGNWKDAEKPPTLTNAERVKRYRDKRKVKYMNNSVFSLGVTTRSFMKKEKTRGSQQEASQEVQAEADQAGHHRVREAGVDSCVRHP